MNKYSRWYINIEIEVVLMKTVDNVVLTLASLNLMNYQKIMSIRLFVCGDLYGKSIRFERN